MKPEWISRRKILKWLKALTGLALGVVIIFFSILLIFGNEGNKSYCAQVQGQLVIKVLSSPIDPKKNLQMIHFSGLASSGEILKDPLLKVSQQAIKLDRKVEMYQWVEQIKDQNSSYSSQWSESLLDSHHFKDPQGHQNPKAMPIISFEQQAAKVRVGDFYLPPVLVEEMKGSIMMDLAQVDSKPLAEKLNKPVLHANHGLYVGKDPQKPQIGDIRIRVMEVLPQTVSIIAQQVGNSVQLYKTPAGGIVGLLVMGDHSPGQMLKEAEQANKAQTMLLSLGTFIMMVVGIYLILWPVALLAGVIPYLGPLVKNDRGYVAFIGGLLMWAIVMGVAWYSYRPLWSLGIILIALLVSCIMLAIRSSSLD